MIFIAVLAVGLGRVLFRHVRGEPNWIAIAVLIGPLGWLSVTEYRHRQVMTTLEAAAGEIAHHPVEVRCASIVSTHTELGWVQFNEDGDPAHSTEIAHSVCGDLSDYIHGDQANPTRDQVIAVHVLAHEAEHLSGFTGEADAECYSVQVTAHVAERLGATPRQASALAARYWDEMYPDVPSDYQSDQCHDGGTLDLNRRDANWPTAAVAPV